ncbi:hypothetical protein VY88_29075 [Azospirillum thiophilum]|uniref:Tail specific protease domain-containing protein n=1 Tax=Azospirillum thiophilum TaxID=528244 RepID=A0AAC8ZVY9_9PROT|nr:S41 family peptidase [Azospirillum thiophilum]ALG74693.1 hypothetical protein AL072_27330 [Azospirillum thiophilum]KJR61523.1 hypothetical protein VY88_29075 [Azospirillum thiophilum]
MLNYLATPLLAATRGTVMEPDAGTRNALCDALRFALENYYVHLPQKRAGFAIDPVQALQLLKESDGIRFSRRLLSIISSLHDRHTTLRLAPPWSGLVAYVPFLLEQYFENGHPRYIVTKRFFGFEEIPLGVEVTHWNGVPIHLYLENLAAETQGAHWSAQMRLALSNLTIRPLAFMLRPSEDWVALTYVDPWGKPYTATTPWRCYASQPEAVSGPVSGAYAMAQGVDYKLLATGAFLRDAGRTTQPSPTGFASQGPFRHGRVPTPAGEAGYLRIFTFQSDAPAQFAATAAGILASLPQERLIVDIRGNPGGNILAGQKLVALLAGGRIPGMAPIAFRNTAQTLALTTLPPLAPWHPSIRLQTSTGLGFSQAFSITPLDDLPPYRYPGRILLIVDALSYSTSDFFAADFVDNGLGPVLGVDPLTGAGGANVWEWGALMELAGPAGGAVAPLPPGYELNLSVRRALRTGTSAGIPIEDVGVPATIVHHLTRTDILDENRDLIAFAARVLG